MTLYALTILVSAFLLFQVQPMLAKSILPWFGGTAGVWTTCLLFFQVMLLMGYLYAHALVRYLKPRRQMMLHAALLLVSVLALPVYPGLRWKPSSPGDPTWGILSLLLVTVGLPYFLLSATGPLLQSWYVRRFQGAAPYWLYALSNAGSMFALVSYPVLFEPFFGTRRQAWIWSVAYGAFVVLCLLAAVRHGRMPVTEVPMETESAVKPGLRLYAMWTALPACASVLLLATTNHLTQNVAAIPFLWVLPLGIYLFTFILCFSGKDRYRRNPYLQLLAVALWTMALLLGIDMQGSVPIKLMVPMLATCLFACCMSCHGELVRLQPHPRYLTHFYLSIAAGGAAGGILVGLVAPHFFNALYETPLGLVACGALVVAALFQDRDLKWFRSWKQPVPVMASAMVLLLATFLAVQVRDSRNGVRLMVRNFYGPLKVHESGKPDSPFHIRTLTNGTINHGEQFVTEPYRYRATTYYGQNTGVGIAIREKLKDSPAIRVGVVGLGTGTLATYGRRGDYYRFYEINPLVSGIARTWFSFLAESKAEVDVAMGDARLSLEREEPQHFDVLAVDAFSGDAIPVHLLTYEAMALYFRHLKPDGILAVHISNRYLDLEPVLEGEARAAGRAARLFDTSPDRADEVLAATWVLVTAKAVDFEGSLPLQSKRTVRLWTDDYSNLFQIVK